MFTRSAKSIRIIGKPDNQLPDKWSYAVCVVFVRFDDSGTVCWVSHSVLKFLQHDFDLCKLHSFSDYLLLLGKFARVKFLSEFDYRYNSRNKQRR